MPFHPQRFIHAANLRLDVPVSVYLSEQLTAKLRHDLEDATLSSFGFVIETCIQQHVDFLLLSGNVFVEADRSLRARLGLLSGFRRLQEKGIPVFVLPGDADPPEAWRAIPNLPDNVTVCATAGGDPEPLERDGKIITTVAASMWYGEKDAFGIQLIPVGSDVIEPFRIGAVSRVGYADSKRMAGLTSTADENLLILEEDSEVNEKFPAVDVSTSVADGESGFLLYMNKLMRECRLNYLALCGELERSLTRLEPGIVHCPGTTQPRSDREADRGLCSLISVDSTGDVTCEKINTSAVDWKQLSVTITPQTELNELLEDMRIALIELPCSLSDRIWLVCWTLTGPLPGVKSFIEEDLELAVAVELGEFQVDDRSIRVLHQIKFLPDAWDLGDREHLAQQYAELLPQTERPSHSELLAHLENSDVTKGWNRRLTALADVIDRTRITTQLRSDGADWFVTDLSELIPHEPASEQDAAVSAADAETQPADADIADGHPNEAAITVDTGNTTIGADPEGDTAALPESATNS